MRRRTTALVVALSVAIGGSFAVGTVASAATVAGATISGNVKGADVPAKNLAGVIVSLSPRDENNTNDYWGKTDVYGNYQFVDVVPGTYQITFDASSASLNYVNQAWGAAADGEPVTFAVTAGSTHPGKDVVLARGGSLSGTVTAAASGARLPDVWVQAYNSDHTSEGSATSDANGRYTIYGLAPGSHTLKFTGFGGGADDQSYIQQWWNNAPTESQSAAITVVVGQDVAGRNAAMVEGARITGTVTDASGAPLVDVLVPVWQKQGTAWNIVDYAYTHADGKYWVSGLAVGSYKLGFAESTDYDDRLVGTLYEPQYYSAKTSLSTANVVTISSAGQNVTNAGVKLSKKGSAPATVGPLVERFAGANRYATGVDISRKSFSPGVPVVYVATGLAFPDALAAAPAAAAQGGPLLLTAATALPAAVKAEISRLAPKKIVVVGGTGAVSASVYTELAGMTPSIRRDAGADRFATSRTIVKNAFTAGSATAFVATGWDYPDALAASAAAGSMGAPVVLVDGKGTSVDANTKTLLSTLKVTKARVVGGTGVVSTAMETSLKSTLGATNVTRLGGSNRYATAIAINKASFTTSNSVYLTNGLGFADALAGAALAGRYKAPLYTVYANCVPQPVLDEIKRLGATNVVLLGGTGVLDANVARLTACR